MSVGFKLSDKESGFIIATPFLSHILVYALSNDTHKFNKNVLAQSSNVRFLPNRNVRL